jgi:hypothetical protein
MGVAHGKFHDDVMIGGCCACQVVQCIGDVMCCIGSVKVALLGVDFLLFLEVVIFSSKEVFEVLPLSLIAGVFFAPFFAGLTVVS